MSGYPVRSSEVVPGYLYAMENPALPGLYKVGWSRRPDRRRKELSSTGVPEEYRLLLAYPVKDAKRAESLAFSLLADLRYNNRKEFFECDFHRMMSVLNSVQRHINVGAPLESTFISDDEIEYLQSRDFMHET